MMNGLSTINRLLGKKNKDVSKSTSNLHKSTTNLDSSSQYNKIVPLAAMNNAPFEQTFRITVLLPRDQLYVTRIGAKTKLYVLLDMICDDKQLDSQKYEFRHPADFSQGFDNELTIGEVGLNEIRLVSKAELYGNHPNNEYRFNTSDIFKYQRNIRESSLSSSDLSRTSRIAMKTASPYSSTNSLNSMDSSGMSTSSKGNNVNGHHPPVAPLRKKRVAPRPPSQNSIPEQETIPENTNGHIFKEPQLPPYSRKNFHVSSPNLYDNQINQKSIDNHFDTIEEINIINTKTSYNNLKNRPTSMYIIREPEVNGNGHQYNHENGVGGSMVDINHSRTSSDSSEVKDPNFGDNPEPTPRKRLFSSSAKKGKAPAPPPRGQSKLQTVNNIVPTPSPRALTRSMLDLSRDNDTIISETDSNYSEADDVHKIKDNVNKLNAINNGHHNVSKVMLNVESIPSTVEPIEANENNVNGSVSIKIITNSDNESQTPPKLASPIISKVHIVPEHLESSDEDDSKVKVYNIETAAVKTITNIIEEQQENGEHPRTPSPTLWTYTLPAPPRFADSSIKSNDFDDKKYFSQSTFIDNTTIISETLTSHFDDVDDIKPVIKGRVLIEDRYEENESEIKTPSPTATIIDSESSAATAEILINSDLEDGYHGSDNKSVRESLLLTLEKRREKIIENEFEFLSSEITDEDNIEEKRKSDIKICAKMNEETVIEDYNVVKNGNHQSEVISELSNFINSNKNGDSITLINNQKNLMKSDLNENSTLSNFKISTYSSEDNQNSVIKISAANEDDGKSEDEVIMRRKISEDSIRKLSSDEEEVQYRTSYNNKKEMAPVKRRSLTVLNKSPKTINRSDSFHSTRSDYLESLNTAANLKMTPRSTSYISLIGAQKWENRTTFTQFNQSNRRKSTSEMSITNSPSLQSLEVIKNILNSSRKNSINHLQAEEIETIDMANIKRNSFTDISTLVQLKSHVEYNQKFKLNSQEKVELKEETQIPEKQEEKHVTPIIVDDDDFKSKSDDEKLQNKMSKTESKATIVSITATASDNESDSKKWKYQGPPTINFTTWNERPKIDVSIKSDKDYKFGGSSTLPRGFRNVNGVTKVKLTSTTTITQEPANGEDTVDNVPLKVNKFQSLQLSDADNSAERLPIVRSVEYKKNIVIPPENKPNVVRQLEKSYFYDNFSRNSNTNNTNNNVNVSTTTVNRVSLNFSKMAPVVKGFKSIENDKEPTTAITTRPVSMAEKPSFTVNKPLHQNRMSSYEMNAKKYEEPSVLPFSQNTLRRTGLKDKILAASTEQQTNCVAVKKEVTTTAPPPPPPAPFAPKTIPIVRGVVVKKQLPAQQIDPRTQLLDAIRSFSKDNLKK